ncbi:hypothetical protein Ddc_02929 [Ditylenchus destructor]|nr:hypothetical protein Ddc_02929 [Ditylenchus destructor]
MVYSTSILLIFSTVATPLLIAMCSRKRNNKLCTKPVQGHDQTTSKHWPSLSHSRQARTAMPKRRSGARHNSSSKRPLHSRAHQIRVPQIEPSSKNVEKTQSSRLGTPKVHEDDAQLFHRYIVHTNNSNRVEERRRAKHKQRVVKERMDRNDYARRLQAHGEDDTLCEVRKATMPELDYMSQYYGKRVVQKDKLTPQKDSHHNSEEDNESLTFYSQRTSCSLECNTPSTAHRPPSVRINNNMTKV